MPLYQVFHFHVGDYWYSPPSLGFFEAEKLNHIERWAETLEGYRGIDVGGRDVHGHIVEIVPTRITEEALLAKTRVHGEILALLAERDAIEARLKELA